MDEWIGLDVRREKSSVMCVGGKNQVPGLSNTAKNYPYCKKVWTHSTLDLKIVALA